MCYLSNISINHGPNAWDRATPSHPPEQLTSWAPEGTRQYLHQRCHSCHHGNRPLSSRQRCSPHVPRSPDAGMQPHRNWHFYLLPTCSSLYKTENQLRVPQAPACIWTRLICIKAEREMRFMERLCRTEEWAVNLTRGLYTCQGCLSPDSGTCYLGM